MSTYLDSVSRAAQPPLSRLQTLVMIVTARCESSNVRAPLFRFCCLGFDPASTNSSRVRPYIHVVLSSVSLDVGPKKNAREKRDASRSKSWRSQKRLLERYSYIYIYIYRERERDIKELYIYIYIYIKGIQYI